MKITEALTLMMAEEASDLHVTVGNPPAIRVHGELRFLENFEPFQAETLETELRELLDPRQIELFRKTLELDFSLDLPGIGRFRANLARERSNLYLSLRAIKVQELDIDALGLPPLCRDLANKHIGLIIVTGPTGSGKSTTLAAMIQYINATSKRRVITLEDPIEYLFANQGCIITQREIGEDTYSFEAGLIHTLRQDPDVIMVGEMRDSATVETALRAAETGHLVLTTAHAPGAPESVDRVVDMFPAQLQSQIRSQLAAVLEGVMYQQLLPSARGGGRVPAFEVMLGNYAVKNLIRESKGHQLYSTIQMSRGQGMQTLDQHLVQLCKDGSITVEVALTRCQNQEEFERDLRSAGVSSNGHQKTEQTLQPWATSTL